MELKKSAWAGWLLFLALLFLSVFYLFGTKILMGYTSSAPFYSIAITEIVAFTGTAFLLPAITQVKLPSKRKLLPSPVYVPLIVYGSVSTGIIVYIVNCLLAAFTGTKFAGLASIYPMVSWGVTQFPGAAFFLLVLIPSVCEEAVLRGRIFPLLEENGLACAVFMSAVCMPLLYVYPGAGTAVLLMGASAALMTFYTDSIIGAMAVHFCCRLALWLGDIINQSASLSDNIRSVNCIAAAILFIFLFLTLKAVEDLLTDKMILKADPGPDNAAANLWNSMYSLGFLLFILLYIARLVIYFMQLI